MTNGEVIGEIIDAEVKDNKLIATAKIKDGKTFKATLFTFGIPDNEGNVYLKDSLDLKSLIGVKVAWRI